MTTEDKGKLNIFDEAERIIGQATRAEIHRRGLLHQEVHVWFFTPQGELIFQHRAPDKDMWADLLDATVGGHVEIGEDYQVAAVKEVAEETGLTIKPVDLIFIKKGRRQSFDPEKKVVNNCWGLVYAYCYRGPLSGLKVEVGKAVGFEAWPLEKIFSLSAEEKKRFIPAYLEPYGQEIFSTIKRHWEELRETGS